MSTCQEAMSRANERQSAYELALLGDYLAYSTMMMREIVDVLAFRAHLSTEYDEAIKMTRKRRNALDASRALPGTLIVFH